MPARSPDKMTKKFKLKLPWSKHKSSKDSGLAENNIADSPEATNENTPASSAGNGRWVGPQPFDNEQNRRPSFRRRRRRRARSFSEGDTIIRTSEPEVQVIPELRINTPHQELQVDDNTALVDKSVWGDTCGSVFDTGKLQPLVRTLSSSALSWSEGLAEVSDSVLESIADSTEMVTKFLFLEDYVGTQDSPNSAADSLDGDSRSSCSRLEPEYNGLVDKTSELDSSSLVDETASASSDESSVEEMLSSIKNEFSSNRGSIIKDISVFDPETSKTVKKKVFMC
mmetsp:Transcript_2196/g.5842  ORF Transcript_2196/g.5842 Transcript_2196/m.5842 type:complete len:283 (-) Transcript_2196:117-965(-)